MKLKILIPLLLLLAGNVEAQNLKGKVLDGETGEPVPYASIFLNTTTIGVTADDGGEFSLKIPEGNYEVVVRMVGYELQVLKISSSHLAENYQIQLMPGTIDLGEIKVSGKRDANWYRNLDIFKEHFLGNSKNAQACKILNPEVLVLDSESEESVLTVKATDVLKVENKNLGYELEYILTGFRLDKKAGEVYFKGYPAFQNMEKYDQKLPRRIAKNREKAFRGSLQHFLQSIYLDRLREEGFKVQVVDWRPNPDRPRDQDIVAAKEIISKSSDFKVKDSLYRNVVLKEKLPKTKLVEKGELFFAERLPNRNLKLEFEGYLRVYYLKEPQESAYFGVAYGTASGPQLSLLRMMVPYTLISPQGTTTDPFDLFLDGYMGWEKMADAMPLNFELP